jgi:FkbM family methyltransferase
MRNWIDTLKHGAKLIARKLGVELKRYSLDTSDSARLQRIFEYHNIDLVLDVGANIGQYCTFLRKLGYRGKVVSFEPLLSAYEQLLQRSRKDKNWTIAPRTAIGERPGEITLHISGNLQSSSVLNMLDAHIRSAPESAYVGERRVAIHRLDEIARSHVDAARSSYLKIDVQGYESQVLDGASGILPRIMGIQMELSLIPLYDRQMLYRAMIDKLDALGYELHAVLPVFSDARSGRLLQMDGIFIRKS